MTYKEFLILVKSDFEVQNYQNYNNVINFFNMFFTKPGYKFIFYFRFSNFFGKSNYRKIFYPLYIIFRFLLKRTEMKYGIQIPYSTKIGKGFKIEHFNGIVINNNSSIGDYCKIRHGVTLGVSDTGSPTLGNNVFIGAGAIIIGGITIGNNTVIGANAVVTKNVPDNAIVAGIPAKILSYNGAEIKLW